MDVIDANWIKARLSGRRGERARLAEAMGIDNDKMSKVLSGKRRVQPHEIPMVIDFFNLPGFSESHQAYQAKQDLQVEDPRGQNASAGHNDLNVGLSGDKLIVNAAVDKDNVDRLLKMIERMRDLLD